MRGLKTWAWVVVLASLSASPAAAQQGGIMSGGQPSGIGLSGGAGALSSSGLAGGLNTSGIGSGAGVGASSGLGGSSLGSSSASSSAITAPTIAAPTGSASSSLDKSNFLSGYYANPYYQGIASSTNSGTPGGFGNPLYGTSSGSAGRGGINTGGLTNRAGTGGLGGLGSNQNSNVSGIVIPIPVQINYAATMRFPTPPVAATRLQTEIRVAIDNTSLIANPKTVQIITDANNNVILRGTVKDDDEARLIEGMVRLTPGVHAIQNELTFPTK